MSLSAPRLNCGFTIYSKSAPAGPLLIAQRRQPPCSAASGLRARTDVQEAASLGVEPVGVGVEPKPGRLEHTAIDLSGDPTERGHLLLC